MNNIPTIDYVAETGQERSYKPFMVGNGLVRFMVNKSSAAMIVHLTEPGPFNRATTKRITTFRSICYNHVYASDAAHVQYKIDQFRTGGAVLMGSKLPESWLQTPKCPADGYTEIPAKAEKNPATGRTLVRLVGEQYADGEVFGEIVEGVSKACKWYYDDDLVRSRLVWPIQCTSMTKPFCLRRLYEIPTDRVNFILPKAAPEFVTRKIRTDHSGVIVEMDVYTARIICMLLGALPYEQPFLGGGSDLNLLFSHLKGLLYGNWEEYMSDKRTVGVKFQSNRV